MQTNALSSRITKVMSLVGFLLAVGSAYSAPLPGSTAAHAKPDDRSPVITVLKAGTAPTIVSGAEANAPAGWLAVELPGPFEAYVSNKDIQKSLEVRPGSEIRLIPKPDAPVITTMEPADRAEITGLMGKWTQIKLDKRMIGYVRVPGNAGGVPAATSPARIATPQPMAPAPVPATAYGVTTAGRAAPQVSLDPSGASLPRLLAGRFVSTRAPFRPRRPFEWALNDDAGKRYAYLDVSKLLLTEQIESYIDHDVVVFGAARPIPGTKDFVIEVESLQLK